MSCGAPCTGFPLASISEELQQRILLHFVPDGTTPSLTMLQLHKAIGLRCTPLWLERMVELWSCNSLGHSNKKDTSVLSVGYALMNHSCLPSVSWHIDGDAVLLHANADLDAGAELTNSYMEDHHMHKPTQLRREHIIETEKGFTCGCARCSDPKERCRRMTCPATGCTGVVPLGCAASEPCKMCGRALSTDECAEWVAREKELKSLLDKFQLFDPDEGDPTNFAPLVLVSKLGKENAPDNIGPNGSDLTKASLKEFGEESDSTSEKSEGDKGHHPRATLPRG